MSQDKKSVEQAASAPNVHQMQADGQKGQGSPSSVPIQDPFMYLLQKN